MVAVALHYDMLPVVKTAQEGEMFPGLDSYRSLATTKKGPTHRKSTLERQVLCAERYHPEKPVHCYLYTQYHLTLFCMTQESSKDSTGRQAKNLPA